MQSFKSKLKEVLYELRHNRDAKFLYLPIKLSLKDLFVLIYNEHLNIQKADQLIINMLLLELVEKKILAANPVNYVQYELGSFTFHDINLITSDNEVFCRGTSLDISEAYAKAVGEVLERISLRFNLEDKVIIASESELLSDFSKDLNIVLVKEFAKPMSGQIELYPRLKVDANDQFSYVEVSCLNDKNKYLIPAQAVYYRNRVNYTNEKVLISGTTHGAGAYYTLDKAMQSAFFEICNRHYYLKSWYAKVVTQRIDVESIDCNLTCYKLIKELEKIDFRVNLLNYSNESNIPSIICVLEKRGGWYVGGTAGTSLDSVILRSISEAFASYLWVMKTNLAGKNDISLNAIANIKKDFIDNKMGTAFYKVLLFSNSYYIKNILDFKDFLSGPLVSYKSVNQQLDNLDVKQLATYLPGKIYIKEIKKGYLNDFNYKVVKIIAPSLYNLHLNEIDARAVVNDIYPQNREFNPFP
jgi:thiazole/oxazole-forming peptide maturase SagD family component